MSEQLLRRSVCTRGFNKWPTGPGSYRFFGDFWSIFWVLGVREWSKNAPGTRTIIFPVSIPHIVHSRPISTQFWHFRPSPIFCISARQRLCISGRQRLCMSGRQRLLLFSTRRISVCLRNRKYCSSATRNSIQILHISALVNSFCPGTRKIGRVIPKSFT